MDGGDQGGQSHGEEEEGAEGAVLRRGLGRGEEGGDCENAHAGDAGEVGELPVRLALEDVKDRGEEGGDDHDGDADVVDAKEEEVEVVGVTREEVADAA